MRFLHLCGSIVFGVLVTNVIWLFLVYDETLEEDRAIVTISWGESNNATSWHDQIANNGGENDDMVDLTTTPNSLQVTEGMILLWTVGGAMHGLFDHTIWYLTACVCCLPGRRMEPFVGLKRHCSICLTFVMIAMGAVSSFLVVVRATLTDNKEDSGLHNSAGLVDDEIQPLTGFEDKSSFQYLLSYGVEIALALLVWYPIVGTILFTGILGCGRIPVLGGRPYEVWQEGNRRRKQIERQRRQEKREQRH